MKNAKQTNTPKIYLHNRYENSDKKAHIKTLLINMEPKQITYSETEMFICTKKNGTFVIAENFFKLGHLNIISALNVLYTVSRVTENWIA